MAASTRAKYCLRGLDARARGRAHVQAHLARVDLREEVAAQLREEQAARRRSGRQKPTRSTTLASESAQASALR